MREKGNKVTKKEEKNWAGRMNGGRWFKKVKCWSYE
jgi:hypothetical protein